MKRLLQSLFGTRSQGKPASPKQMLNLETLEDRCLLTTATLSYLPFTHFGMLTVNGSANNNAITVQHSGSQITVTDPQESFSASFNASSVQILIVNGQDGNDTIQINLVATDNIAVSVHGNQGNDIINGSVLANKLYGDAGADVLRGGIGNDSLYGGDGDDLLYGGSESIQLDGNDSLCGNDGVDSLYGGTGNDSLDGGASQDYLYGGYNLGYLPLNDGDDVLRADVDDFVVHGEKGADQIIYANQDLSRLNGIDRDPANLESFINNYVHMDPITFTHNGVHYTIHNIHLVAGGVSITDPTGPNPITRLTFDADFRAESWYGSTSGTMRFSVQPVLNMVLGETDQVESATVTMTNTSVEEVHINGIPNLVDDPGQLRVWINEALAAQDPIDITNVAQLYVNSDLWPDHHTS